MAHSDEPITVYADYVCPFCYLGRRSLETYRNEREEPIAIDWHPFDLRSQKRGPDGEIDHSVDDGKDEAYFEQARKNVERLQKEYDAEEMRNLDDIPDEVDSLPAQVASYYVKSNHPDDWEAFDRGLYEALWVDGEDIGDEDVIADVAEAAGLDPAEIREAVADEDIRERLFDEFATAQRRGITGVPTFAYGEHAARGAVPPEHLQRLVEGT